MYLLDTHILLWWLAGNSPLSEEALTVIQNPQELIWISSVTVWEIVIKQSLGKLKAPDNLVEVISKNSFKELPVTFNHVESLRDLPNHHSDPFDRLLIAQALSENLTLITRDRKIAAYSLKILEG